MSDDERAEIELLRAENERLQAANKELAASIARAKTDRAMRPVLERMYGPPHHLDWRGQVL